MTTDKVGMQQQQHSIALKAPGKILSPFLVHSNFRVRLQMANYAGYGKLGHRQYSLK